MEITSLAIMGVIAIIVVILLIKLVTKINRTINNISNTVTPIFNMVKEADQQQLVTPRTLDGTESVHMPNINKDFPELSIEVAKGYIKNFLPQYFNALSTGNVDIIKDDCNSQLLDKVKVMSGNTSREVFSDVFVHKVVVSGYKRTSSAATITFQAAVEYKSSRNKRVAQTKYSISYSYYLDYGDEGENVSLRCKHCGAPIYSVGVKICPFCDSAIEAAISRTWKITDVKYIL